MRSRVPAIFATVVACVMTAFAAPALAQTSPTQDAYGQGQVQQVVGGGGPSGGGPSDIIPPPTGEAVDEGRDVVPPPARPPVAVERGGQVPSAGGDLPFTGFEAGLVALAGLALVGTGFAMRRVARTPV